MPEYIPTYIYTNIPASFFCDCRDGYELKTDGRNCDGKTLALPCSLFMFEAHWCLKSSYWSFKVRENRKQNISF